MSCVNFYSCVRQEAPRGRKGLFQLTTLRSHSPSLREVRAGAWRQELMQRPQRNAAYWLAPPGLFSLLPYNQRTTCIGIVSHTMGLAFSH